jgi:hypothetical protein
VRRGRPHARPRRGGADHRGTTEGRRTATTAPTTNRRPTRVGYYFEPYVGKKYWKDGYKGLRVLLLGESFHTMGTRGWRKAAQDLISEYVGGKDFSRTWPTIEAITTTGRPLPDDSEFPGSHDVPRLKAADHEPAYRYVLGPRQATLAGSFYHPTHLGKGRSVKQWNQWARRLLRTAAR